jgi:V/A-type H+-transporting ATPase subunit I
MKLVSMFGPKADMDNALSDYLMDMNVEFEAPLSLFKNTSGFTPHTELNPFESIMKRFTEVFDYAGIDYSSIKRQKGDFSREEFEEYIENFDKQVHSLRDNIKDLDEKKKKLALLKESLLPIIESDIHIEDLTRLKFMKFRFGHLPIENYKNLDKYLGDLPAYFTAVKTDRNDVWGFYFSADEKTHQVDHIMSTLYFERIYIEGENSGTPKEIVKKADIRLVKITDEIQELTERMNKIIAIQKDKLLNVFSSVKYYYDMHKIKHFAAYTQNKFYLTFWTEEKEIKHLKKLLENDSKINIAFDDAEIHDDVRVPTKLKNFPIFRPFEEFVKMYGVPKYNEIDPTAFLSIIYSLFFGMMFGDVGHGAVLLLLGIVLSLCKKGGFLGKIAIPLGIASTIFGFLYGTCFGFEGHEAIISPLWFTPMEDMTRILLTTVAIGVGVLILCMVFNVINGIKQKDWQKIFFSQNGVAGLAFYVMALYAGISVFTGMENSLSTALIVILVSLLLIFLQEPLGDLLKGHKHWMPKDKGGFFIQSFFELFEILLSFVTNTMSFVRIGAFALNHAGMMSVVIMFMHSMNSTGSVIIAILGNVLVMGLEGLIVGIQVLRLGFYEMFSRFYDGGGREFKPMNNN